MSVNTKGGIDVVANVIKNLFRRDSTRLALGRWRAHTTYQKDLKVDYSNEDHCGTCSQYRMSKYKPLDRQGSKYNVSNIKFDASSSQ